jgi:hypothetical protein
MKFSPTIAVLVTILLCSCASYQAKPAAMPVPDTMPYSYSDTYLKFHADPCVKVDRQMELFDADLAKMGVIPIQVFVSNKSDRLFTLPQAYTWLELSDGTKIPRTYLSEFFKQREEPKEEPKEPPEPKQSPEEEPSFASELGRAALAGAIQGAIEGALPLIIMGAVLSSPIWGTAWYLHYRSEQVWTQRLADYDGKEQQLFLDKDESGYGFMFFMPLPGTPAFDEATLNVSITEADETPISLFHIPLKGLEFKGTPAEQK